MNISSHFGHIVDGWILNGFSMDSVKKHVDIEQLMSSATKENSLTLFPVMTKNSTSVAEMLLRKARLAKSGVGFHSASTIAHL